MQSGDEVVQQTSRTASWVAKSGRSVQITDDLGALGRSSRSRVMTSQPSAAPRSRSPSPDYGLASPEGGGRVASSSNTSAPHSTTPAVVRKEPKLVKGAIEKNRANFPDRYQKALMESAEGRVTSTRLVNGMESFNRKLIEKHDDYFGVPIRAQGLRKPQEIQRTGRFQYEQK